MYRSLSVYWKEDRHHESAIKQAAKKTSQQARLTTNSTVPLQGAARQRLPYTDIMRDSLPHVGSSHFNQPS